MFEKIFPIIVFIALGYLTKTIRRDSTEQNRSEVLVDFAIFISLPSLIILQVSKLELSSELFYIVIAGWIAMFVAIVIAYIISSSLGLDRKSIATFMIMSSFGNTSFVGLAYVEAFYGKVGLNPLIIYDQFVTIMPISIVGSMIISYGLANDKFKVDVKEIFKFPPLIAVFIALFLNYFSLEIPKLFVKSLEILGNTTVPLALFAIGLRLSFAEAFSQMRNTIILLSIKMFIMPLLLLISIKLIYSELSLAWSVAIIELSMPPMIVAGVMVIKARLNSSLAISSVGVGLIISLISTPIWYNLIK